MEKDIDSMSSWLSSMHAFMADHYGREDSSMMLSNLLKKVRKTADAIEDVIDECILHSQPYTFHRYAITRKVHGYAHHIRHQLPLRGVLAKIESIKNHIKDIKSQSAAFNRYFSPSSSCSTNRVSHLLPDDEMAGYETLKTQLIRRLVHREERLLTLAVDGSPGSGKTTLVKNIFRKLQTEAKASGDLHHGPPIQLQIYLEGKRYLIVVDDVWQDHKDIWSNLRNALPDSKRGSRIIVTTNDSNLSFVDANFSLRGLDAWKLFCRRAFPDGECPSELKDISLQIMERCDGLALAIVTVAATLAQKPHIPNEWERFHSNFGNEIRGSSSLSTIYDALMRSYRDLSSSLKCCFLYMSIFPEDQTVERGRLIHLWVAESFAMVTEGEDRTAEEVAEDYLDQLIRRNLLHVSTWDIHASQPRNCRVSSLVLKFIIKKCNQDHFASIFPNQTTQIIQQRLSVHDHLNNLPEDGDFAIVRSMFLFRLPEEPLLDFETKLRKFKLIKVLDMQNAPLAEFPKEITTNFTLARYLSFRDTKIKIIPSSINKLYYLETLDLKETDVTELPQEISNLHNLRHLLAYKYDKALDSVQGVKLHPGIHKLVKLHNLLFVKVGPLGTKILEDLKALTQLRKLGVTALRKEHGKPLWAAVEEMKSLKTLDITSESKEECIPVEEMEHPPKTLECLNLTGLLEEIPTWIGELNNLLSIGLKWSRLRHSPLTTLKGLPKLTELKLVDSFTGEDLIFEASGFKKLKILRIEDFANVNMIKIEYGAMPEIKQISVLECPNVTSMLGVQTLKVELNIRHSLSRVVGTST